VIEKPFGRDLQTAKELNDIVDAVFPAESVFRIDHYLGKETVQNILALRFANALYEPIWNRSYVDHVQITMSEDIGIGGRAGYYDGIGAARDVIQNHLLQLLALTTMEEPVSFDADSLRQEKEKVLSAVRLPADLALGTARGQYAAGWQGGRQVAGYLEEEGIPADSRTETYAAVRLSVDTRRWAGVPFYLRTGKRLTRRMTEIALIFQRAPHLPFAATDTKELGKNALVIRVQPDEGVTVRFGSKVPGSAMEVRDVNMDFAYGESFTESSPEAYERLILDVLIGDPPLFPRQEEVELSWRILDPIEQFWAENTKPDQYASGGAGPSSADAMMARDGRTWRRLLVLSGKRNHSNDDRLDRHHHRRHQPGADRGAAAAGRHDARHGAHADHRDRRGGPVRRYPGRQPGGSGAPVPDPRHHHPQAEGRLAA
jgi:glucose-6-phosphate 1-dehydrogenase